MAEGGWTALLYLFACQFSVLFYSLRLRLPPSNSFPLSFVLFLVIFKHLLYFNMTAMFSSADTSSTDSNDGLSRTVDRIIEKQGCYMIYIYNSITILFQHSFKFHHNFVRKFVSISDTYEEQATGSLPSMKTFVYTGCVCFSCFVFTQCVCFS